ncbi:helix-turn-helix transcriptional regulator [Ensifer canadensis]
MLQPGHSGTEELTDLIYGAAFGECSWQDFLDRLANTLPNGRSALHYHDLATPRSYVPSVSGFDAEDIEQFNQHFAAVNPWIPKAMLVPTGQGICGEQIVARGELIKSEFYNDWLKRQTGCETSVGVTIIRSATRTFMLSTCTSSTDPDLNQRAAEQYTYLAPHLKRAFDLLRKRDMFAPGHGEGRDLLDSVGVGVIYVTENLRIRSMNACAERMISNNAPLRISPGGRVTLPSTGSAAALELLSLRINTHAEPHVSLVRATDGAAYRVTLVRLRSDVFVELLNGPTVAILIEPATSLLPEERREHLKDIHGLTPAEVRIASGLAAGLSLREMAQANGVSYETIRTQLKSIYTKTEVNSQAALVSLLMR